MEQTKLDRINELARLAKERELTEAEQTERAALRKEYIEDMKSSLRAQLERTSKKTRIRAKEKSGGKRGEKNAKMSGSTR